MKGKPAVFLRLGFEMRVGYTHVEEIRCLEIVEWSQRVFHFHISNLTFLFYIVFRIKSNYMSFSSQQQQVSALHIPRKIFFLSAKDCYHLVWEPRLCGYGSDTIFWIYGCWYDYCINAYDCQASQNGTSKCRCLEDENAVASQRTGSFFFFILEKREAALMASSIKLMLL